MMRSPLDAITAQSESGNRNYYPGGRPVQSPAGAMYAMQVMPATARDPGFGIRPATGNSPDEYNRVGRDYRAKMEQRYGGDPAKMWAAYNWGPGNLDKALAAHGDRWIDHAPRETRDYVKRNLGMLQRKPKTLQDVLQPQPMGNVPLGVEQAGPIQQAPDYGQLAAMAAATPEVKKGGLFGSGLSLGEALVHGLNGYLAGRGNPVGSANMEMMAQRARIQEDRNFAREQLAAKIEETRQERMAKAMEPPAFVRNAQAYAGLPQDVQRQVADFYSVTNPQFTNIEQADGSVMRVPVARGPQAGPQPGAEEDGYVFLGGDPADPKNWKAR